MLDDERRIGQPERVPDEPRPKQSFPRDKCVHPAMSRREVLQALLDAREQLDRICINQGDGFVDDAIVGREQCVRLGQIVDQIVAVGDEINATDSSQP
jgi:hypothetical protein